MSEETLIQWASSTWNPWIGCDKISPGCKFCYIVTTTPFRTRGLKHGDPRQRLTEAYWKQPARWNAAAEAALRGWEAAGKMEAMGMPVKKEIAKYGMTKPERPRIFPSLCDWLDEKVPIEWLADFLKVIHDTPHMDWLLLTKRPENFYGRIKDALWTLEGLPLDDEGDSEDLPATKAGAMLNAWIGGEPPANVWFGASAENQEWFDKRYEILRDIPAKVKFISAEPLLGPIYFKGKLTSEVPFKPGYLPSVVNNIDWVIVGGESGDEPRPCSLDWIGSIVAQCHESGVPVFVKQLGGRPVFTNANMWDFPDDAVLQQHGEHLASGKLITKHKKGGDWKEWPADLLVREFPKL